MSEEKAEAKKTLKDLIALHKRAMIGGGVFILIAAMVIGGLVWNDFYYAHHAYSGVMIGSMDVGGLTKEQITEKLDNWYSQWWEAQLHYKAVSEDNRVLKEVSFYPVVTDQESGDSYEFISFDFKKSGEEAFEFGKSGNLFQRLSNQVSLYTQPKTISANVFVDKNRLIAVLQNQLAALEVPLQNSTFEWSTSERLPTISSEKEGDTFDYEDAVASTVAHLNRLNQEPIVVIRAHVEPTISRLDLEQKRVDIPVVKKLFPITLSYQDDRIDLERTWRINWSDIYKSIQLEQNAQGQQHFVVQATADLESFWKPIEQQVNTIAQDAKFEVDGDGKVQQFQASQMGYVVNREETLKRINERLGAVADSKEVILLAYDEVLPQVTTSSVNDLGIKEVLGVGYSNFAGSPTNRVHNISVGVNRLNGLLIAPDKEFSLLEALQPFTEQAGYLPELVIKGDKIEPEIGGGLCQIGSTTFRAAMKAGLKITQRRNHSLVVSYYNDPRNGNPGTDATIYEGAVDFKFLNDTPNYVLLITSMNKQTGDLVFTFWGTSDGREADYTEPVVSKWLPAGDTKYVVSSEIESGKQKCQSAHPGAVASFTYTVKRPDGEVVDELFTSNYRALPKICLIPPDDPNASPSEQEDSGIESGDSSTQTPPASTSEVLSN